MDDNVIFISDQLQIPISELRFRYSRSGGPGGQHVNRSETQVELLWDMANSPSLSEEQRRRITEVLKNRIDSEGMLHLTSSETRSQERNRQAVIQRFAGYLHAALKPRRKRKRTRVPARAKARRLQEKRRRSERKRWRGPVSEEE